MVRLVVAEGALYRDYSQHRGPQSWTVGSSPQDGGRGLVLISGATRDLVSMFPLWLHWGGCILWRSAEVQTQGALRNSLHGAGR